MYKRSLPSPLSISCKQSWGVVHSSTGLGSSAFSTELEVYIFTMYTSKNKISLFLQPIYVQLTKVKSGLQISMRIGELFSLFLIQNICCGYSKEPSQ